MELNDSQLNVNKWRWKTKKWGVEMDNRGKVILLGRDPRQTLPIVKKGGRAHIFRACIQTLPLFPKMKEYRLEKNMRADKILT